MAETQQQFADDLEAIRPVAPVRERRQVFDSLQRYTPTGEAIPLDVDTGAPFLTRLRASLVSDEPTKQAIFQDAFAGARVESVRSRKGEPHMVIRDYKDPETGQVKDLLVDEKGASLKDLADLGETGVQILGAYLAIRGGSPLTSKLAPGGLARTAAESAIGSLGGQLAAGGVEGTMRAYEGQPVNPGEIASRRTIGALMDTGFDLGIAAPVIGGTKLLNLRRGVAATQEAANAIAARNRLAEETGVDVPFSIGEATGKESLREREQLLEKTILGGGRMREQRLAKEQALRKMQEALPGTYGVPAEQLPSKDVVGTQAVSALRSLTTAAEEGTARARAGAVAEATTDLSHAMTASTGMANREVLQDYAGTLARDVVNLKHDVLNDIEGELQVEARKLGADKPFIDTAAAKTKVAQLVNSKYMVGRDLLETTPPSLLKVVNDVTGLPATATWDAVRNVRHSVNRLINQGEILGDTDTGVLKQISKTLTESIGEGTKALPQAAADAVKRANKFYAEGIEQFQVKGITDILADPTQRKLGPFAIFRQAAGDPDQYFRLKDALTKPLMLEGKVADAASAAAGENAWNVFKQGMWDEMTDSSGKAANRALLDPTKLLNKIESLPKSVRDDLLGPASDTITTSLKRLEVLDNPKLPADEALTILRQGGDTAPAQILQLAKREQELDKLYSNQVVKKFTKGEIGSEAIQPGQFIDRFADAAPIADVRDAMNKLEMANPGMTKLVRSKKVQSVLENAAESPLENMASAKKLAKEIGSQESQERLKAILGEPGLRRLNDFVDMLTHLQHNGEVTTAMGGGMAGGQQKFKMLTVLSAIHSLPKQIQYRVAAMVISNPNLYRMATGPVVPLDPTKLLRAIIVSDDAIADLIGEYKGEALRTFNTINNQGQPTQAEFQQQLQQKK